MYHFQLQLARVSHSLIAEKVAFCRRWNLKRFAYARTQSQQISIQFRRKQYSRLKNKQFFGFIDNTERRKEWLQMFKKTQNSRQVYSISFNKPTTNQQENGGNMTDVKC